MSNLNILYNLSKLMRSQWWSYEDLKELQDKKLRAIINFSYHNIPLYHTKFKNANIMPDDIKTTEDLVKIPYLTKDEIQQNFPKNIVSPNVDLQKCWAPHTSGSTGKPLTTIYDKKAEDFEKACAMRPNISCGQKPFDKWVVITSPGNIERKNITKKWFQKFGIYSQECISLFEDIKKQISMLEKLNPDILDGVSSSLYLIAKEIKAQNIDKIKPKIIYGTSDLLTKYIRETINTVFDVEMYDQFGSIEMGRTAWECPSHCGYHIDMESVVMEFIKKGEPVVSGERGEIVYTNLYNYAMPFIRFKIEDVGIPTDEKCNCGRGLPLMKIIEGRKDDFTIVPDGRIFSPTIWIVLLMHYNLDQFKVIQEKIDEIKIQIVPKESFTLETIDELKKRVNAVLGNEVKIKVEIVDKIPKEKSGKMKSMVSKIHSDW